MKIIRINVQGLFGAVAVDLDTSAPINVIAGANGAGKTSIRDAVRLALTANLGRVSLKRDAGAIVTEGMKSGSVSLDTAHGESFKVAVTSAGKLTDSHKGKATDAAIELALDGQRLARMPDTERKAALFGLLKVQHDRAAVRARLVSRGIAEAYINAIDGEFAHGFEVAATKARERATEARGAWKAITGEVYGATKSQGWKAPVPEVDWDAADAAKRMLEARGDAVTAAAQALGSLRQAQSEFDAKSARLTTARIEADKLDRAQVKLAHDEAELKRWQDELARAADAAGAEPRVGLVHELAQALADLVQEFQASAIEPNEADDGAWARAEGTLQRYVATHGEFPSAEGDAAQRGRLPQLRSTVDLMQRSVNNAADAVTKARAAAAVVAELTPMVASGFDASQVHAAEGALQGAQQALRDAQAMVARYDELCAAHKGAQAATDKAAKHHADVEAWVKLEQALSPDGIPGELLAEALKPLNDRLSQTAEDTGWARIEVDRGMQITAAGRAYGLLSESEQWRTEAALAEAVSYVGGARLLCLDRMDVLDMKGRQQLMQWLNVLATTAEIDTALIFATLKTAPAGLPDTFTAHWVESGVSRPALAEPA
jgi:hypothetical protein